MNYDTHPLGCECGQCQAIKYGRGHPSGRDCGQCAATDQKAEQPVTPRRGRLAAVYMLREDGDWDCQCVFDTENRTYEEMWSQASGAENAADEMVANLGAMGEVAKVVFFDDWIDVVDVLDSEEVGS